MPTAYITAPAGDASQIAELLVEEELAACVNLVNCHSVYRWEDDVVSDDEVILLAKTTDDAYDDLAERVVAVHPYDVPCVERFEEADVLPAFADWRSRSVR